MQDLYEEAFGAFRPSDDRLAAVKFSLCVIMLDHRIDDLLALLTPNGPVAVLEGCPGWTIERIDSTEKIGARFRVFVDPEEFDLKFPEVIVDRESFSKFVNRVVNVAAEINIVSEFDLREIVARVSN